MVRKERLELSHLALSLGIAEPNSSASPYFSNFRHKKTSYKLVNLFPQLN